MSDAPADEDQLETADALMQAVGRLVRRMRAASNPGELTWSQAATLGRLEREGPQSIAGLARAESVRPQSMGVSIAALEEEGWVERRPHPTDGRQALFALTEKGRVQRSERRSAKLDWLAARMEALSPAERRTLAAAADLIARLAR